ncbi:hypothetical protein H5410_031255 [Solanum commersonii]|uniref:Uncharacterized protein n=1 Tax=Solanum commersonii TaxID=4109 RepID=A0A9J5YIL7_SOLCO|nr:hypothetical protein H5410_031255 [Solanum commersonii]
MFINNRNSCYKGMIPNLQDRRPGDPITRDINALINMKQNYMDYLQLELFSMNIFDSLKLLKYSKNLK